MLICVLHTEFAAQLRNVGVSQAEFARICATTKVAVNRWCKGGRNVPQWAWALALALRSAAPSELCCQPNLKWADVLGVREDCPLSVAATARSRLAKRYHPDMGGSVQAMQRINAAYDIAKRLRESGIEG